MLAKCTIIGKPNSGKTTMLRLLIFLLTKNKHYQSIQLFEKSGFGLRQKQSQQVFNNADLRVIITLKVNERIIKIAISTIGDTEEEVRLNWCLFNNKCTPDEFDICVSPCHINDRSADAEQLETAWRIGASTSNKKYGPILFLKCILLDLRNNFLRNSMNGNTDTVNNLICDALKNGALLSLKKQNKDKTRELSAATALIVYKEMCNMLNL